MNSNIKSIFIENDKVKHLIGVISIIAITAVCVADYFAKTSLDGAYLVIAAIALTIVLITAITINAICIKARLETRTNIVAFVVAFYGTIFHTAIYIYPIVWDICHNLIF